MQPIYFQSPGHLYVCDLTSEASDLINKLPPDAVRKLHVIVYDVDRIKMPSAGIIGTIRSMDKRATVFHCFDKEDKAALKRKLMGYPRNEFYFIRVDRRLRASLGPDHTVEFTKEGVRELWDDLRGRKIAFYNTQEAPSKDASL